MSLFTTDQIGQTLELPGFPQRIVSLVPSQTEFLFDLGLAEQIVGITRFCIHPIERVEHVTKVGGTKQLYFDTIEALRPDLIIANKEENNLEDIIRLQQLCRVWVSDVNTLDDANRMMLELGRVTNRADAASKLVDEVIQQFAVWPVQDVTFYSCAYFIWRKPYMVAANHTFIHQMLRHFGLRNVFEQHLRYPEVTLTQVAELNPDIIFLSSEPYAFGEKHVEEFQTVVPSAKVIIVDGEMFSWYGSRLRYVPDYFAKLRNSMLRS